MAGRKIAVYRNQHPSEAGIGRHLAVAAGGRINVESGEQLSDSEFHSRSGHGGAANFGAGRLKVCITVQGRSGAVLQWVAVS